MGAIPLEHGLAVAGILFCLGLVGLMVRRNILFVLMSLEVMMNASALAFVVARWEGEVDEAKLHAALGGKPKGSAQNEAEPINVKSLLP